MYRKRDHFGWPRGSVLGVIELRRLVAAWLWAVLVLLRRVLWVQVSAKNRIRDTQKKKQSYKKDDHDRYQKEQDDLAEPSRNERNDW